MMQASSQFNTQDFWEVFREQQEQDDQQSEMLSSIQQEQQQQQQHKGFSLDEREEEEDPIYVNTDVNIVEDDNVFFSTRAGNLEELEDATNFVVMMTEEELNSNASDASEMDYGFLLNDLEYSSSLTSLSFRTSAPTTTSSSSSNQDNMFSPTPIDTNRMHVVPSVNLPAMKDFLSTSERAHLRSLMELLKQAPVMMVSTGMPLAAVPPVLPMDVASSSASIVAATTTPEVVSSSEADDNDAEDEDDSTTTTSTPTAAVSWNQRLCQLLAFRESHGHVNVPYDYPPNPPLAQWVKRQRHQYRLLKEGRHSNLTPYRLEQLESIDYCWDSREAHWLDRFYELQAFYAKNGHVRVSKRGPCTSLAVWLKRQRHQGRLLLQGKVDGTNMTQARLCKLMEVGVKFAC